MRRFADPAALDAVIVSHMHADHVVDLIPLRYLTSLPPTKRAVPLDVYVYPGGIEGLQRYGLAASVGENQRFFDASMRLREYDPAGALTVGDLEIRFMRTIHYVQAYAMRVSTQAASIAYSADTAPSADVVRAARDADLFICECALGPRGRDHRPRGHSNAGEAGKMAAQAGVKHLLLTHYGAENDPRELQQAAAQEFGGRITVAEDGLEFSL